MSGFFVPVFLSRMFYVYDERNKKSYEIPKA